ncbi:short chain dehydrogenase [Hypoxylon trugodes]|uniref:short chain dehydrogenase n=1 Tax=Hypoxylon trugodes TaxID=326681 RepID=UPI0021914670|nr:short chain dehydrogenase [Hypoxylon trugodes]KAI1384795.1 short chain dehydrogenase [Hypoxylon trugodes]
MDTSRLFRVEGIVAVITGGGSGIGLTMAKALAGAGAKKVYILGRRREVLEKAAASQPCFVPVQCDITEKASLQSAVDFITKDIGYVNLFIANSGTYGPRKAWNNLPVKELRKQLFEDASMEEFTDTFRLNVTGTLFSFLAFLELLDEGNKRSLNGGFGAPDKKGSDAPSIQSQIIITSSVSAFARFPYAPLGYGISKHALVHLAKMASSNLAQHSIRVNAICPGLYPSEMADVLISGRDPSKEAPNDPRFIPARKFGSDDDMGGTILYLASRAGSFCNGMILLHDGGKVSTVLADY